MKEQLEENLDIERDVRREQRIRAMRRRKEQQDMVRRWLRIAIPAAGVFIIAIILIVKVIGKPASLEGEKLQQTERNGAENGTLEIDKNNLERAALSEYAKGDFASVRDFANSLVRKMDQISLNPMDYVDKTIVAYKNPGKNYPTPYITSAFSGMLFNYYC